ncbi:hypothetical protein COLO4_29799 [Corchorus olitorius]|uniref:DUF4378 domain-containing protein n=1 Tax=Corchorus olitorius TaxID=93759 RepID=A0A1R3HD83_9ROSI|nr:hypothetical protein COLO4_29799 [Corchorus olitorius]
MAQRHLHELLQEDQEPFLLKKYIADRRCQLKKSSPRTQLQIKKRKPISQNPNFPANFCKNACFFSFHDSPDPRKSPLFEFQSPAKSPCKSPNAIFLQVPARTAALLLEAALRIQKQSSSKTKNNGGGTFGLFEALLLVTGHLSSLLRPLPPAATKNSPVSVLDPPFEDDDEQHVDDDDENDGYDLECSYAIVQRAKQHLLHKLRRFEKLAELDPIELEKRMLEEEQDDDDDIDQEHCIYEQEEEDELELESASSDNEMNVDGFVNEVLKSSFHSLRHIPEDMKRLVSDLIAEEQTEQDCDIVKRVCKRLESWKEVESNTIDMMVEQDFRRELDGWKRNQEQIKETALEVEYAIFGLLMEELSEELVSLNEA